MNGGGRRGDRQMRPSSALDLLERALLLMLAAPPRALATFLAGSAPFALAFMAFVVDATFDAGLAAGTARLPAFAILLTITYFGMKLAHASYARQLFAEAAGLGDATPSGTGEGDDGTTRSDQRTGAIATQLRWQAWALWVLPAAALVTFPYAWVHAYFQGLSITSSPARARRFAQDINPQEKA